MKYKFIDSRLQFYKIVPCGASKDTVATNESNERIARETNATNIAMNDQNNATQLRLQQEMNEFNSLQEQLKRAEEAGVNPNAVISGSVNGNLQTSLPQTQAGHADAWRVENPYAERLATVEQLRGIVNDYFVRDQIMAQTDLTKSQAQAQYTENKYIDDLRGLGISMGRAQVSKTYTEIGNMFSERQLMQEQVNQTKANIANMNERTRQTFLDNYFKVDAVNSFTAYVREDLNRRGIPKDQQLSDDSIRGIYFGALNLYNVPLSQIQTNEVQQSLMKTQAGVNTAMQGLINAQTKGQYIKNFLDETTGLADRFADIDLKDSQTNQNNQNVKIRAWQTTPWAQTQFAGQLALGNLQTSSNIENTDADTHKKKVETVETGTRAVKNLVGVIPGL